MQREGRVGRELFRAVAAAQGADDEAPLLEDEIDAPLLQRQAEGARVLADAAVGVGLRAKREGRLDRGAQVDAAPTPQARPAALNFNPWTTIILKMRPCSAGGMPSP